MNKHSGGPKAVVIGGSAGGLPALKTIFAELPQKFSASILVVLHLHPRSDCLQLQETLDEVCRLPVRIAEDKQLAESGGIYLAPANYHLQVEPDHRLSLSIDEKVNFSRPAIDVLFESAAEVFRSELVGVVLTGGSKDGAAGLRRIKELGGWTIVQDPEEAEVRTMPQSALEACEVDQILALKAIGRFLADLA